MKKLWLLLTIVFFALDFATAQNVGISNTSPTEKLHVDSGNIKIGKVTWQNSTHSSYLKFGDGNYITLGEEEADDKLTIRAKELYFRPSASYASIPLSIQGTSNYSHFYFGTNEDTYIRGGKSSSNVIIGDGGGRTGINVYPVRAMLEQNGAIGTTAAIFGGDGAGISLQKNWPVVGFNHYFDGVTHKSIGQGFSGVFGVNQDNGNLYYGSWPFAAIPNANLNSGYVSRFNLTRTGRIGIGTDDPQSDLHIVNEFADAYAGSGIRLTRNGALIATNWNIFLNQTGQLSFGYTDNFNSSAYPISYISFNGSWVQASDEHFKKNINYLSNETMLGKINLLRPAKYHFIFEKDQQPYSYGFISQEVEKIFPDIVETNEKGKYLSYQNFIPILTQGMQEQQQQIEALQKENTNLKVRLEKIENLVANKVNH